MPDFCFFVFQTSCAEIQQLVPDAKSSYYWVHIKGKKAQVYCDMNNYGAITSNHVPVVNICYSSILVLLKFSSYMVQWESIMSL